MEIERRFLVKDFPTHLMADAKREECISAYIKRTVQLKLRARKIGDRFFLTEKIGTGLVREEKEEEISKEEFDKLSKSAIEIIKKIRYYIPYNDITLEVDVYEDLIKYPATVEVEFKTEEAASKFIPPGWFGREIGN